MAERVLNERYRLDAEVGRGGMGVVYRAHDLLLDRDIALKLLSELAPGARAADGVVTTGGTRLLAEAQAAARLNHPNIVSVYDAGWAHVPERDGQVPYIVMELVPGPSLHERPPDGLDDALRITGQVCAGLEHAHSLGIVHRDIKPENVLLMPDGTAKLSDFGLAYSVASRVSSDGMVVGTVFYLAPEMALGQPFDGRADLYALGVMLYELVTGQLPFQADDPIAVISQHLHAPVVPPRARNPAVPPALDALIQRLLSKNPDDRPGSAAEVCQALSDVAGGQALSATAVETEDNRFLLDRIVRGRLVARGVELAQIRAAWQRAIAGEGQVLLISGEPGVGKTRLVRELCTQVQVAGARALLGECWAQGAAPYAPFADMVSQALRACAEEAVSLPAFVMAGLLALVPTLGIPLAEMPPLPDLDPESKQQRLFEDAALMVTALSERAPVLMVLEDAHWADGGSLAMLHHLARRTRRQRVLIVVTYREVGLDQALPLQEVLVELNRERLAARLKLGRLSREETGELLAALFAEAIAPEFLEAIYRETEGNPFFVEEVSKALVESGDVRFVDGRWDRPVADRLHVPQSVRMAIQPRVGRLPQAAQDTLHLASIIGREFVFEVLAAASDLDEETLIEALETAERAQLIEEVAGRRQVTFAFGHALIPATLAEEVHTLRRRRLHRRVAEAIERLSPGDCEALAHHYAAAGDEERALLYATRAGDRAAEVYAHAEAERHYRVALDLVATAASRAPLLKKLGMVLSGQDREIEAIEVFRQAIDLFAQEGNRDEVAGTYALMGGAARSAGDTRRFLNLCREGLARVAAPEYRSGASASLSTEPRVEDGPGVAALLFAAGHACYFNGLPGEAADMLHHALATAERIDHVALQVDALCLLRRLPGHTAEQGLAEVRRAVELAESAGLPGQAALAHANLAYPLLRNLEPAAARTHYLRAAELIRHTGSVSAELHTRGWATWLALWQGDLASAEKELPVLRELADACPPTGPAAMGVEHIESLLLNYQGVLDQAVAGLRSLAAKARATGDMQMLALVVPELFDALLELGADQEADEMAAEALQLGNRVFNLNVLVLFELAVLRCRQGNLEAAHSLLREARDKAAAPWFSPLDAVFVSWAEACLAAAERRWPEALNHFEATAGVFGRAGARPYHARVLAAWAEVHLARGEADDLERAAALLRQARDEFAAMGAAGYVARVTARLRHCPPLES